MTLTVKEHKIFCCRMHNFIYILYKYSLLLLFLASMQAGFMWGIRDHILGMFVSIVTITFFITHKNIFIVSQKRLFICLLFVIAATIGVKENLNAYLRSVFILLPCLFFFLIKREVIFKDIIELITNFFAILLPISLLAFITSFFLHLPAFGYFEHPSGVYSIYTNYIIFIKSPFYDIRFSSIFLEPGHLGMICSFILFANKYNFKDWRVISILICSLFTLSLAGYVLILIGYLFILFLGGKITISKILMSLFFLLGSYIFAISYNNGDNYVNEMIISRLELDEEKGFKGNNRVYGSLEDYFIFFIKSDNLWRGIGSQEFVAIRETETFGGAGWKVYLLMNGLLSLSFIFLAYLYLGLKLSNDKLFAFLFFLLFLLAFIQRAYPFWASWLLLYMSSIKQPLHDKSITYSCGGN